MNSKKVALNFKWHPYRNTTLAIAPRLLVTLTVLSIISLSKSEGIGRSGQLLRLSDDLNLEHPIYTLDFGYRWSLFLPVLVALFSTVFYSRYLHDRSANHSPILLFLSAIAVAVCLLFERSDGGTYFWQSIPLWYALLLWNAMYFSFMICSTPSGKGAGLGMLEYMSWLLPLGLYYFSMYFNPYFSIVNVRYLTLAIIPLAFIIVGARNALQKPSVWELLMEMTALHAFIMLLSLQEKLG